MLHVVFQTSDVHAIKEAIKLDTSLEGDVVEIKDEFAVGPIANIYETEGYQARRDWWKQVLEFSPYTGAHDIVDDKLTVHNLIKSLQEDETLQVWIWMGQNQHDVCGYYWLMSQLKDFQGRLFILYLNNLPFINEKGGIFYPGSLHEIQPKEFLKAKKLARPITLSEFEIDPDEWAKLCREDKGVRLLEGGKKLVQRGYGYYDNELMNMPGKDWTKVSKLFQQYYTKVKETTGDAYLLWRLMQLIQEGKLEMQGNTRNMKEFEVRLPGAEGV